MCGNSRHVRDTPERSFFVVADVLVYKKISFLVFLDLLSTQPKKGILLSCWELGMLVWKRVSYLFSLCALVHTGLLFTVCAQIACREWAEDPGRERVKEPDPIKFLQQP